MGLGEIWRDYKRILREDLFFTDYHDFGEKKLRNDSQILNEAVFFKEHHDFGTKIGKFDIDWK